MLRKKYLLAILSLLPLSSFAQLVIPARPPMLPVTQNIYEGNPAQGDPSIETRLANAKSYQAVLQLQLQILNKMISMLQQYVDAQAALHITWVDANANIPTKNAFTIDIGNGNKETLCHGKFERGIHPGVIVPGGCLISYGGSAIILPTFQVLTGNLTATWKTNNALTTPQNTPLMTDTVSARIMKGNWQENPIPVAGGAEKGMPLFICRANFNNAYHLGKVVGNNCNIPVDGKEMYVGQFQLLYGEKR